MCLAHGKYMGRPLRHRLQIARHPLDEATCGRHPCAHRAILSHILRLAFGQRGIGPIEPAGHLVGDGQIEPGCGAHVIPRAGRGCERPSGERDDGFGISGRFVGHNGAQGVDFASQVNGVFRLIRHLRDEAFGPVDQIQHMRRVELAQSGHPGRHEHQIRVCRDRLRREHAESAFVELPLFGVHQGMAVLCHQADSRRCIMPQQRVLQRLLKQALTGEPGAGPGVKHARPRRHRAVAPAGSAGNCGRDGGSDTSGARCPGTR